MLAKLFAALLTGVLSLGIVSPQFLSPEIAAAPEPVPQTAHREAADPQQATLTAQEAEAIALADAGLSLAQVTLQPTRLDRDDGIPHWEVEFRHGEWEYDYDIHAQTGTVLERDKEYDPPKEAKSPASQNIPAEQPAAEITAEEAKAIALAHAGLTAGQVTRLQAEKDREDGIWTYEIEFRHGRLEYEYEIHAQTGSILSWEKDD